MSRAFPSMAALLGLIAVAGYQNRDKLAELVGRQTGGVSNTGGSPQPSGVGSVLGNLMGAGGVGAGGLLSNGLRELVDRFQQNGKGEVAHSWVGKGPNQEIAPHELEAAIGPDVLADLTQRTGLSREELLSRLTQQLPSAVDRYTPDGTLPS
jgi:uncharacterized protein YidB (DUF937 family)